MSSKVEKKQNNNEKKKSAQENQKRTELEKELNIERKHKNSGKIPNMTQMQINHLNYYNEIAKQNTRSMMNNPSIKDVIRITSDESCLEELEKKKQSKDLQKLLDQLPLKRVERINYKTKEIGHMRRDLAKYSHTSKYVYINKEKGKEFAGNVFARRIKERGKYVPMKSIDDLYNTEKNKKLSRTPNTKYNMNNKLLTLNNSRNNSEIWTKKYKGKNYSVKKSTEKKNDNNDNNTIETNNRRNILNIRKTLREEDIINKTKTYNKRNNQIMNILNNKGNENEKTNTINKMNNSNLNQPETAEKSMNSIESNKDYNNLRHHSIVSSTLIPQREERIKINLRSKFGAGGNDKNVIQKKIVKNNATMKNNNNNNNRGVQSNVRMRVRGTYTTEKKEN